jgi:hypothetical protein
MERYKGSILEDYLAMFTGELTEKDYIEHAVKSGRVEGFDYLLEVVDEFEIVESNNDWEYFVKVADYYGLEKLNEDELKKMKSALLIVVKAHQKNSPDFIN